MHIQFQLPTKQCTSGNFLVHHLNIQHDMASNMTSNMMSTRQPQYNFFLDECICQTTRMKLTGRVHQIYIIYILYYYKYYINIYNMIIYILHILHIYTPLIHIFICAASLGWSCALQAVCINSCLQPLPIMEGVSLRGYNINREIFYSMALWYKGC